MEKNDFWQRFEQLINLLQSKVLVDFWNFMFVFRPPLPSKASI